MSKSLTAKQQFWSEHLLQADQFDNSLANYARSQGLSAQHLYQWRSVLRKREITSVATKTLFMEVSQPAFARPSLTLQVGRAQMVFSALPDAQWLENLISAHD